MATTNSIKQMESPRGRRLSTRFPQLVIRTSSVCVVSLMFASGCMDSLEKQATKDRGKSIIHKTTQDIGEFKPEDGLKVRDSSINASDPVTAPLAAYQPMIQRISDIEITHAVRIFQALNDRYPKDYDEFMSKIIKENNIQLPQLPLSLAYQYDVENHKLVVVEKTSDEAEGQAVEAGDE